MEENIIKNFAYSSSASPEKFIAGWETLFSNSDVISCPITSCILKSGPSCIEAFDGKEVSIISEKPWEVSASTD